MRGRALRAAVEEAPGKERPRPPRPAVLVILKTCGQPVSVLPAEVVVEEELLQRQPVITVAAQAAHMAEAVEARAWAARMCPVVARAAKASSSPRIPLRSP